MFLKKSSTFLTLLIILSISATQLNCKKTSSVTDNPPQQEQPVIVDDAVKVTATITGTVIDENNKPVTSVSVFAGGTNTTTTDAMGNFVFKNLNISAANGFVTVVKTGYFKATRSFVTSAGKNNYVKIQLIKKVLTSTLTAAAGGTVTTTDGATINFPANAFVTSSGTAFTGTVYVYAKWIDPTAPNLPLIIPGDLRGIDSANRESVLKSYGMVGAEIQDNNGNSLKIAPGKTASINFPIPASFQATAPQTIPLWHFDEATARWKMEGTATKSGNNYIGQVNKFSFWNVDVPGNFIKLDVHLVNSVSNLPLANTLVKITSILSNISGYGHTNDSGFVSGYVPKNENLTLEVISGTTCTNAVVHTQNIGPFSTNTSLGTILVTLQSDSYIVFSGNVKNCSNAPVTNGYVSISVDGMANLIANTDAQGNFSGTLLKCTAGSVNYSYVGVDLSTGKYGPALSGNSASNNIILNNISACGNSISGIFIGGRIGNNAVMWIDGVPKYLTNYVIPTTYAYGETVDLRVENNDTFALIYSSQNKLLLWKNGVTTEIVNFYNLANTIYPNFDIYNGEVYCATFKSTQNNTIFDPQLWKNGVTIPLSKDTFQNAFAHKVKVVNGDTYVVGVVWSSNTLQKAVYWKNGVLNLLPNPNGYNLYNSTAVDIDGVGADVFITGQDAPNSLFWKNGIANLVKPPNAASTIKFRTIAASGNDIYTGGQTIDNSIYKATTWKNGSPTFLIAANQNQTLDIFDIAVKNNIVFSVGALGTWNGTNSTYKPVCYQDNTVIALQGFSVNDDVKLISIFIK